MRDLFLIISGIGIGMVIGGIAAALVIRRRERAAIQSLDTSTDKLAAADKAARKLTSKL